MQWLRAAATDAGVLRGHGVTHVVNCMNRPEYNVQPGISYFDFPIENWPSAMPDARPRLASSVGRGRGPAPSRANVAAVRALFAPPMDFIGHAVGAGGTGLGHCFAGAHRAGTTGVAWLMHAEGLGAAAATAAAQQLRPVIDPKFHWGLAQLLVLLEMALAGGDGDSSDPPPPAAAPVPKKKKSPRVQGNWGH